MRRNGTGIRIASGERKKLGKEDAGHCWGKAWMAFCRPHKRFLLGSDPDVVRRDGTSDHPVCRRVVGLRCRRVFHVVSNDISPDCFCEELASMFRLRVEL